MRVKSTILKERESVENGYTTENLEEITERFIDESIFVDADSMSIEKVVGVVEEANYETGVGVVIEAEIVDEDIFKLMEKGHVDIAPRLILEEFTSKKVEDVDGLFTTPRVDYNVGETQIIEE